MRLLVTVTPRAKRNSLEQLRDGSWKARLAAIPEKGKANQVLIELLAERFSVPKRNITITSGGSARTKLVELLPSPPKPR